MRPNSAWLAVCTIALLALSAGKAQAFCFDRAARAFGLDSRLLWSIAKVESGFNPSVINRNRDGSYDFGLMQINSSWYSVIGRESWMALGDPCHNVEIGAWILSDCIRKHGRRWDAVACYNAGNAITRGMAYAEKVKKAYFTNDQPVN